MSSFEEIIQQLQYALSETEKSKVALTIVSSHMKQSMRLLDIAGEHSENSTYTITDAMVEAKPTDIETAKNLIMAVSISSFTTNTITQGLADNVELCIKQMDAACTSLESYIGKIS